MDDNLRDTKVKTMQELNWGNPTRWFNFKRITPPGINTFLEGVGSLEHIHSHLRFLSMHQRKGAAEEFHF